MGECRERKKWQSGDLAPLGEIKMYDGDVTGSARICASPESLFPSTARDLAGTTQCSFSKTENIWDKKKILTELSLSGGF